MDTVEQVVDGIKKATMAEQPTQKPQGQKKDKKDKKRGDVVEDSRPLEVLSAGIANFG